MRKNLLDLLMFGTFSVAFVGLHAFRHGPGTALSDNGVSPKTVQTILRHTDMATTLRYYIHSDMDSQRSALAAIGTNVPIGTTI